MKKTVYFKNLDALRSIACLFVLVSHLFGEKFIEMIPLSGYVDRSIVEFFLLNGIFGVHIFFVLSGFLITYLILAEIEVRGRLDLAFFYWRRMLRIWPVYLAVILFTFALCTLSGSVIHENFLLSLTFLSNFDEIRIAGTPGQISNAMIGPTWSVSIEEQFYLVWALCFALVAKQYQKWIPLGALLCATLFYIVFRDRSYAFFYMHTVSNFLFLGGGGLLAYYSTKKTPFFVKLTKLSGQKWWGILGIGLTILILANITLRSSPLGLWVYNSLQVGFLCLMILNQTTGESRPLELGSSKVLVYFARYTYGLYLYHRIGEWVVHSGLQSMGWEISSPFDQFWVSMASLVMALALAAISYRFMEQPILAYKNKFSFITKGGSDRKSEPKEN